jgi:hypothetical protein
MPGSPALVRLMALAEITIGTYTLLFGGRIAALLVAIVYLGFAAFVGYALAKGGVVASCGCFGRDDTPPTWAHLILNLAAAAVSLGAVAAAVSGILDAVADDPLAGLVLVGFVAMGTWFAYLILNVVPTVIPVRTKP